MDLGIKGKSALVCAASKGLGKGCALALAREGVNLVITARGKEALEATAEEIRKATGAKVVAVAGDITTAEGRAQALAACPHPDILVNNAGGPPPGDFRNWSREDWIKAIDANMLTPIELIKATVDGMIARKFGRVVNITSAAVRMPIPELGLSNGARTGLTGFVAGLSRQTAQHNVTINALLPGPFDTDRLRGNMEFNAKKLGKTAAELARRSEPGQTLRHHRGVRRRLRVPRQRARGLHHRPEPAHGRRRLPGNLLGAGVTIGARCVDAPSPATSRAEPERVRRRCRVALRLRAGRPSRSAITLARIYGDRRRPHATAVCNRAAVMLRERWRHPLIAGRGRHAAVRC